MYCKKCGKQLADTDTFCASCGQSTKAQTQSTSTISDKATAITKSAAKLISSKDVYTVSSIGASILFILFLLMKWLEIPVLTYLSSLFGGSSDTGSFSILKLLLSLKGIASNGYLSDSSQTLMIILVLVLTVLLVLPIYFLGKYIYVYFSKKAVDIRLFRLGLIYIIVLFAVCFIGMLIINSTISAETSGIYSEALSLTGIAYFVGIAAIVARILLVKKLQEEINKKNTANAAEIVNLNK